MSKYVGNRKFYKMVLAIAIPIMLQNGITNVVNLVDNVMIGKLGLEQMSGVSIVNTLMFVFSLCIFGATSGASIYGAQYYGNGDYKGLCHSFAFKIYVSILIVAACIAAFIFKGPELIQLYIHEGEEGIGDVMLTLSYGERYLRIILFSLLPFAIVQCYASTLRETGRTVIPMIAGIASVVVNLVFNYILIYGKCGAPKLGVEGGAIATVLARLVECAIVVVYTHAKKFTFLKEFWRGFCIPRKVFFAILRKGLPLFLNESLWSLGMAFLNKLYSERGLVVVAAQNINSQVFNISNIAFIALGSAIAIIVGQMLGAGDFENAIDTDRKILAFDVVCTAGIAVLVAVFAGLFPMLYDPEKEVAALATTIIRITALFLPLNAFVHCTYFTLRTGGKTLVTFLFDSVYTWVICVPVAYVLVNHTNLGFVQIIFLVQAVDLIKVTVGAILLKKRVWVKRLVVEKTA